MRVPANTAPSEAGREDGAEPTACSSRGQGRDLREVRLIEELAKLHYEAPVLLREVVIAGERLDEAERWAGESFDEAASSRDENAVDRAVAAALESDHLQQAEVEAMERWMAHRVRVEALLEQAAAFLREDKTH